jgi:hypothetical protein
LAQNGDAPLAFLHCNGYKKDGNNCSRYFDKGKPTYENRYDIRNCSDRPHLSKYNRYYLVFLSVDIHMPLDILFFDTQSFPIIAG